MKIEYMRCPNCKGSMYKFQQFLYHNKIVRKYVCKNKNCNALIQTEEIIIYNSVMKGENYEYDRLG